MGVFWLVVNVAAAVWGIADNGIPALIASNAFVAGILAAQLVYDPMLERR